MRLHNWLFDVRWFGTDRETRRTTVFLVGGQSVALFIPGYVLFSAIFAPESAFTYTVLIAGWLAAVAGLLALRFGHEIAASRIVVLGGLWSVVAALTVEGGAACVHVGAFAPAIMSAAALLLSVRVTVALTLASALVVVCTYFMQRLGLHPVPLPSGFDVVAPVTQLVAAGAFAAGLIHAFASTLAKLREREAELEQSEARYTSLFEQSPDGILLLSADGHIQAANQAACKLLGTSADGSGASFLELPFDEVSLAPARDLATGKARTSELLLKTGKLPRVLAINATQLHSPAAGIQLTVRDVTQAKEAEEAQRVLQQRLRRSERMEAFGQLAGGVSHDFNNILTGILGHLSLTRVRLEKRGVDDEVLRGLDALERSAERGAAVTKQLLQFSRRSELDAGETDLGQAVTESEKLLRPLIREDVRLELDIQPTGSVGVSTSAVGQIIMNLVINACDAMTQGGTVLIRAGQREVSSAGASGEGELPPGRYAELEIRDTGTGIADSVLPRIFEPFFTTKAPGQGTGLGLSTVHGIVRRAGGHILVNSVLNQGTVFRVCLPQLGREAAKNVERAPLAVPQGQKQFILVCEDEATIRDVISEVLTQHGFQVRATGSPREAMELARTLGRQLSLVISDVIMPEMNGPQLVAALTAELPKLSVLYISGYTAGLLKDLGISDHDDRLLSKPFTPSSLLERVGAILKKSESGQPATL